MQTMHTPSDGDQIELPDEQQVMGSLAIFLIGVMSLGAILAAVYFR